MNLNRRDCLKQIAIAAALPTLGIESGLSVFGATPAFAAVRRDKRVIAKWMDTWMSPSRTPIGTLHVSRFREPIWWLLKPIAWKPSGGQNQSLPSVEVPAGFVTDFASIPRIFWSILSPDGEYTYPAIIHDYLYWQQTVSREVADNVFLNAMEDFTIPRATAFTIYNAVRLAGGSAWSDNAELKNRQERRILKEFPDDPRVRWIDWKKRPGVFL